MSQTQTMTKAVEDIARKYMGIKTLETQNSDQKDIHEISVWQLKQALMAAYFAGRVNKL